MASSKLFTRKDGTSYYEIRVHLSRNEPIYKTRWNVPEGWSSKAIARALAKEEAEFERKCKEGEILTRKQKQEKKFQEEEAAAKLLTLEQYANSVFMPTKKITISENTRYSYQLNIDNHIVPALGSVKLSEITPAMITKLLTDFQAEHAHATCIKLYNVMNGIFEMAFMDDSIEKNPMLKVKRPVPKKEEKAVNEEEKAYSLEDTKRILSCLRNEPLKWRSYVMLSLDTGARRGEICGLRWSDIDWDRKQITLSNNLQYTPKKGVYETTLKGNKVHKVDIGDSTIELLKQLRTEQAESCISVYIFSQEGKPEPIHPDTPEGYYKKFGMKYGIKKFHPHKLRHTSATLAILNGADIVSVSQRLGHADTATTLRMYAHANEESIRKAGQTVRDLLS